MDNDFTSLKIIVFYFISGEEEMSFYIQHIETRKYLDIRGASKEKGAQVILYEFTGNKNQQWTYKKGRLVSKLSGCVIYERLNISVSFPIPFFPQRDSIYEAE